MSFVLTKFRSSAIRHRAFIRSLRYSQDNAVAELSPSRTTLLRRYHYVL